MYETRQNKEKVSRRTNTDDAHQSIKSKNYVYQKIDIPRNYEEHIKGECDGKNLTGGHSQPLMVSKWNQIEPDNLKIIGVQNDDEPYEAEWTINSYTDKKRVKKFGRKVNKKSTFFPNNWNYNEIVKQIRSVCLMGGYNFGASESGKFIAKSGNTVYPIILRE